MDKVIDNVIGYKGGYEVELVNEAPSGVDVFCPVCTLVLRAPMQFKCCTRHLCEPCYNKCKQQSTNCPLCGTNNSEAFSDGAWRRITLGLKVYCPNKQRGCYWENELHLLHDHLKICSCEMIACPRTCGLSVERRNKEFHVANICRLRPFKCEHCLRMGTFDSITGTHYNACREYPLKCPNECSNKTIKRKDMKSHIDVCPLEEVICMFSEVECKFKCRRKDMKEHLDSSIQEHLTMTMKTVHLLKARVKTLEEKH